MKTVPSPLSLFFLPPALSQPRPSPVETLSFTPPFSHFFRIFFFHLPDSPPFYLTLLYPCPLYFLLSLRSFWSRSLPFGSVSYVSDLTNSGRRFLFPPPCNLYLLSPALSVLCVYETTPPPPPPTLYPSIFPCRLRTHASTGVGLFPMLHILL